MAEAGALARRTSFRMGVSIIEGVRHRKGTRPMRKVSYLVLGAAIGAAAVAWGPQSAVLFSSGARAAAADTYRQLILFGDAFEKISTEYVEEPDEAKMIEASIYGMLSSLDPHSSYMDAPTFSEMQEQMQGQFGGLGIDVTVQDGLMTVVAPIDDTPAAKAGILSGDIITDIEGEAVQGLTLNQTVDKMRGAINTPVTLKIARGPKKDVKEFTIVRDVIKIRSVRSHVEGDDLGYIRITQFNEQTYDGLKSAMDKFQTAPGDKLKGYILDLRNNPGGLLDQSIEVVNAFLDRGEIVSTRGRNADETQRYNARRGGDLSHGKPIVILINGGSASASEIVSGALQDHKRATLIGTRSFGKGSVQTIIPLGQNGALRLTTARYYTPSGSSIQAKGIEPDIQVLEDVPDDLKGKDDTKGEASLKGHLKNGDDEKTGSQAYVPPDAKDDKQLIAAVDLLHGVKKAMAIPIEPAAAAPAEGAKDQAAQPTSAIQHGAANPD
jgi:carboxyl-terminal processing protease